MVYMNSAEGFAFIPTVKMWFEKVNESNRQHAVCDNNKDIPASIHTCPVPAPIPAHPHCHWPQSTAACHDDA